MVSYLKSINFVFLLNFSAKIAKYSIFIYLSKYVSYTSLFYRNYLFTLNLFTISSRSDEILANS
jgi:hypothetical protein